MKLLNFAVDALATARITRLVVEDTILDDVRDKIWARYPVDSSKIGYLLTCHKCASVWAAALVATGLLPRRVRYIVALSELSIALRDALD